MRTREEQISGLGERINRGCHDLPLSQILARNYILEAEQRGYERARAECAADTRRLDWLLSRAHYGIPGFDPKVSGRSPSERKEALIRAIDAAMENAND